MFLTFQEKYIYIFKFLDSMESYSFWPSLSSLIQNATLQTFLLNILNSLLILVAVLVMVAWYTWTERKLLSTAQRRSGPNVQGFWGILQAFADGLKLLLKEIIIPVKANQTIYLLSAIWSFAIAIVGWAVIPFTPDFVLFHTEYSVLYTLCFSSLGVYGIIFAGWASNSKYAFLGALRSAAQMISYEVSMSLVLIPVIMLAGSFNYGKIIVSQTSYWNCFLLLPLFIIFFVSILAETNRAPFDLPEAEAELVAGYNIEHAGFTFALFFLAEYSNMLLYSVITAILFLGGWLAPFNYFNPSLLWLIVKTLFVAFFFVFVRANFPRYRYDQLMRLGWKTFLPFCLGYLIFIAAFLQEVKIFPTQQDMSVFSLLFSDKPFVYRLSGEKRFALLCFYCVIILRAWRARIIPIVQKKWQQPLYLFYTDQELYRVLHRQIELYATICAKMKLPFPNEVLDELYTPIPVWKAVTARIPDSYINNYIAQVKVKKWRPRRDWKVSSYIRAYLCGKHDFWI